MSRPRKNKRGETKNCTFLLRPSSPFSFSPLRSPKKLQKCPHYLSPTSQARRLPLFLYFPFLFLGELSASVFGFVLQGLLSSLEKLFLLLELLIAVHIYPYFFCCQAAFLRMETIVLPEICAKPKCFLLWNSQFLSAHRFPCPPAL